MSMAKIFVRPIPFPVPEFGVSERGPCKDSMGEMNSHLWIAYNLCDYMGHLRKAPYQDQMSPLAGPRWLGWFVRGSAGPVGLAQLVQPGWLNVLDSLVEGLAGLLLAGWTSRSTSPAGLANSAGLASASSARLAGGAYPSSLATSILWVRNWCWRTALPEFPCSLCQKIPVV